MGLQGYPKLSYISLRKTVCGNKISQAISLISELPGEVNFLGCPVIEYQPERKGPKLCLCPLPPHLQVSPKNTMPIPISDPAETIVRRKENVIWSTNPPEKGRK